MRNPAYLWRLTGRSLWLAAAIGSVFFASQSADAAAIEAIHGKNYTLSSKHGPWMIMVTSLWGATPEQEEQAVKAAAELVYQLRKKGVPAYTYQQDDQVEEINALDRSGRMRHKKLTAQHGMIAVLAGNYHNADDKVAQQTLKFVKKFKPTVAVEWKGKTVEVPLALNKAFMTRNPMLPPEELARKHRDPLIVKLNSNVDHSLFENKGKYTLIVYSFYGQSMVKPVNFEKFDGMLANKSKSRAGLNLDNGARETWELMTTMRNQGIEAYVYHERFRSIVTVGAFKSPNDPEIARLVENFRAKQKLNPETKQVVLVAESIQIPGKRKGDHPLKAWTMDPEPQLFEIPK